MDDIFSKYSILVNDRKLFDTAFTHTSYSNEYPDCDNYERLEFWEMQF